MLNDFPKEIMVETINWILDLVFGYEWARKQTGVHAQFWYEDTCCIPTSYNTFGTLEHLYSRRSVFKEENN